VRRQPDVLDERQLGRQCVREDLRHRAGVAGVPNSDRLGRPSAFLSGTPAGSGIT
jgi:hypothetical protein